MAVPWYPANSQKVKRIYKNTKILLVNIKDKNSVRDKLIWTKRPNKTFYSIQFFSSFAHSTSVHFLLQRLWGKSIQLHSVTENFLNAVKFWDTLGNALVYTLTLWSSVSAIVETRMSMGLRLSTASNFIPIWKPCGGLWKATPFGNCANQNLNSKPSSFL